MIRFAATTLVLTALASPGWSQCGIQRLDVSGRTDVSGTSVLIGDQNDSATHFAGGAVHVFVDTGVTLEGTQVLRASDDRPNLLFGQDVALDGDWAIVSSEPGVYFFQRTQVGWGERQFLDLGPLPWRTVDLRGDVAVATVQLASGVSAFRVFELQGAAWTEMQELQPSIAAQIDSLALTDETIWVGAAEATGFNGGVFLFERTGPGAAWGQATRIGGEGADLFARFGEQLATDGERVLVGAPRDNAPLLGAGYVFERSGGASGEWLQTQRLLGNGFYGSGVAIQGDKLAITGPTDALWETWELNGAAWERTASIRTVGFLPAFTSDGTRLLLGDANGTVVFDLSQNGEPRQYCLGGLNSTGQRAFVNGQGSTSLATNEFVLIARRLPANAAGLFLFGAGSTQIPFGDGFRCVEGSIRRLPLTTAGSGGRVVFPVDFSGAPFDTLTVPNTWFFQFWYRDGDSSTEFDFNLTNGLEVCLGP